MDVNAPMAERASNDFVVFLLVALVLFTCLSSLRPTEASPASGRAVSVWSKISIQSADAFSAQNGHALGDCLRPKSVECFSIQQNSWVSDSLGNFVLWVQNTIQLAKLYNSIYFGTFIFQIWNGSYAQVPMVCEPESSIRNSCRAPFYTEASPYPQSFTFYSHISNTGFESVVEMSNNFGAMKWVIPPAVKCPCYIWTMPSNLPPWGHSSYELVAVGLNNFAEAEFRSDTSGTFGPILVESDGVWHEAMVESIHCTTPLDCSGQLATGESARNLLWNSTSKGFYWSKDAYDQGTYITAALSQAIVPPALPMPRLEIFLYAEFKSSYAYLTIYDAMHRGLGVDPGTGKRIADIPNSSITHNSSEDLLIIDPSGAYELLLTAAGNTAFKLFLSKTSNTGDFLGSQTSNGTLNIGYSKQLHLDVSNMELNSAESNLKTELLPIAGIMIALVVFVSIIAGYLYVRRKHVEE